MMSIRQIAFSLGLGALSVAGLIASQDAELLLHEPFDSLEERPLAGQMEWRDNSKAGAAIVLGAGEASPTRHLSLHEGGAVHHALPSLAGDAREIALSFTCRRTATEAGHNLQIAFRSANNEPVLFLNLRGSGRSLDVGPSAHTLKELALSSPLPVGKWVQVEAVWDIRNERLQLKLFSAEDGTQYLNDSVELRFEAPARLVVGSTSKVQPGEWSVDELRVEARK